MSGDLDRILTDAAASPSGPVDVDALHARAERSRRRGRLAAGLCAATLVVVAGAGVLAALGTSRVELASPPGGAEAPDWPLRLRAEAVLNRPGGTEAPVMIEMAGSSWSEWLAITAHGPAHTEVSVDVTAAEGTHGRFVGGVEWVYTDAPFTLLDDAADVVASAPLWDMTYIDLWGEWWVDYRPGLVPHPVPHPLLRPWAATAAAMADPPIERSSENVAAVEPGPEWDERRRHVADQLDIDPAALAVRSWDTWLDGVCPSEDASDCRVTITVVLLESADVPLLVEVHGGGGFDGRLEVTHLDLEEEHEGGPGDGSGNAPSPDPVALVGLWEVRDAAGEEPGAVLRIDLGAVGLFRGCGMISGGWDATSEGMLLLSPRSWSTPCGRAPWPQWLDDAAAHRPDGDGHVLLDADGGVLARLVPGEEPTVASHLSQSLAEPPVVTGETRAALAPAAPLPADLRPAEREALVGHWTPTDARPASLAHLHLQADGRLRASDGCNELTGRWRLGDEGRLLAVTMGTTLMGCENVPTSARIAGAARAGLSGADELVLLDRRAAELGRFERSDCQPTAPLAQPGRAQHFETAEEAARSVPGLPAGGTLTEDGTSEGKAAFTWSTGGVVTQRIYVVGGGDRWALAAWEHCERTGHAD